MQWEIDRRSFTRLAASFCVCAAVSPNALSLEGEPQFPPADAPGEIPQVLPPITFDNVCFQKGGRPFYLYSGEIHYFRVPKKDWRRRMDLLREAGGNCVATYIPWLIHEPTEGIFTFGGSDGVTDFEGFVETARQAGLYVIARPGPYQYAELRFAGLPAWLCSKYPEILARDIKNKPLAEEPVSYLHPTFLAKARAWFNVVCPLIARHKVSNGGPIALVQIDNEMMGIHLWNGSVDYNTQSMGFGKDEGRFAVFLSKKYSHIGELNKRYRTSFASFGAVRPFPMASSASAAELLRLKDYFQFYVEGVSEYAQILAGFMRSNGIDLPLLINSAFSEMNIVYEGMARSLGPRLLVAADHYYNLDQSWPQNNPTPQYALNLFCSLETLRIMGMPPTVMELQGGSAADWPPIMPADAKACYWANLALGMKGNNFYIFTGGPNPPNTGVTADVYDYGAAIGSDGSIRPLYEVQKELGSFLLNHPWLCQAERECDFRVVVDLRYSRANSYWKSRGEFLLSDGEAWDFAKRGVLNSAFCASLSPILCDLRKDEWALEKGTPVAIVSSACMARDLQEKIVQFVRDGGKALILPVLPTHDENLNPCTLLGDFLGAPKLRLNASVFPRITINGVVNVESNLDTFVTTAPPPRAEVIGKDESNGEIIAWNLRTGDAGQVTFLGFRWYHAMREHEYMLKSLLAKLGLRQRVFCSNPNVWTSLRSNGSNAILYAMNLSSSPMDAEISRDFSQGSIRW